MKKIIPFQLKKALAAEKAAQDQLEAAQKVREQADAIRIEWEQLATNYDRSAGAVKRAEETIAALQENIRNIEELAVSRIGEEFEQNQPVAHVAIEAAKGKLALPILERGLQARRDELNAHAQRMRKFAEKYDIPREVLKELPNE